LISIQGVGDVLGGLVSARVVSRVGESRTVATGIMLSAAGSLGMVYPSLWLASPSAIPIGTGAVESRNAGRETRIFPDTERGRLAPYPYRQLHTGCRPSGQ
jgi:hypothetical protein